MSNTAIQPPPQQQTPEPDYMLFGVLAFTPLVFWMLWKSRSKKAKVGRARLATAAEVRQSQKDALKAINNERECSLWIGMPDKFEMSPSGQIAMVPNKHTVFLRKANEHIMVYGGSGGGKSRWFLNPLGRAAALKGIPIVAIDAKGDEEQYKGSKIAPTSEIAAFALEQDYEVFSIAPFFPDSRCLNLVSLLKTASDTATAKQLGFSVTLNGLEEGDRPDNWDKSAAQLIGAGLMMAKGQPEGQGDDLATAQMILARLAADPKSIKSANINPYQQAAFDEFLASANSPQTAASVAFSALRMLSDIMIPEITAVFCRKTNIPIVLGRKQMLIFRIDPEYRTVLMPLVAAAVEIILQRNIYSGQGIGGLALLDELPQYRIPTLPKIAAVARSKDWVLAYGAQGQSILEESYGKARTEALMENCQTLGIMRLASIETAKKYSDATGKEEITTKNRSSGKGGSSSTYQETVRDVVPLEELTQQPDGRCILYSPTVTSTNMEGGIKGEKRVRIPYRHQFVLTKKERAAMKRAPKVWRPYRDNEIKKSTAKPLTERELLARQQLVKKLLPETKTQNNDPHVDKQAKDVFDAVFHAQSV